VTAGISGNAEPNWNATSGGTTADGTVVWKNIGRGSDWLIPFGLAVEPAPTTADPSRYNIVVPDEGWSMVFRMSADGELLAPTPLASNVWFTPSLHVITISPPDPPEPPPVRFGASPTGVLGFGTTQVTLGLTTDKPATCRYSTEPGVAYASM